MAKGELIYDADLATCHLSLFTAERRIEVLERRIMQWHRDYEGLRTLRDKRIAELERRLQKEHKLRKKWERRCAEERERCLESRPARIGERGLLADSWDNGYKAALADWEAAIRALDNE